jgi:hypothetical protein
MCLVKDAGGGSNLEVRLIGDHTDLDGHVSRLRRDCRQDIGDDSLVDQKILAKPFAGNMPRHDLANLELSAVQAGALVANPVQPVRVTL